LAKVASVTCENGVSQLLEPLACSAETLTLQALFERNGTTNVYKLAWRARPPPSAGNFITIAQAPGCVLTKFIDRRKTGDERFKPYGNVYLFNLKQVPIARLDDIGDLLVRTLLDDYTSCALFGEIIDPARAKGVRNSHGAIIKRITTRPCARALIGGPRSMLTMFRCRLAWKPPISMRAQLRRPAHCRLSSTVRDASRRRRRDTG
jgi:hypothetical protein